MFAREAHPAYCEPRRVMLMGLTPQMLQRYCNAMVTYGRLDGRGGLSADKEKKAPRHQVQYRLLMPAPVPLGVFPASPLCRRGLAFRHRRPRREPFFTQTAGGPQAVCLAASDLAFRPREGTASALGMRTTYSMYSSVSLFSAQARIPERRHGVHRMGEGVEKQPHIPHQGRRFFPFHPAGQQIRHQPVGLGAN